MSEKEVKAVEKEEVETTEEVEETTEKTVEEIEAEAKALEAEIKKLKSQKESEEIKQNQLRRLEKAREKLKNLSSEPQREVKKDEVDVRDLITLAKLDIPEESDKAKILKKYRDAGIISNYTEGLEHVGVKAEFEALDAKNNAHSIIDENSDDETRLKTQKEVIKQYQSSGEIPQDPKMQEALAKENLKNMGF